MSLQDEVVAQSNGAHFLRADLHIHSFGGSGSYDVKDNTMTPAAIVDLAIAENLLVIAITDHNTIGNVREAVQHANGKNILVVPGVELSTPDGHLLIWFFRNFPVKNHWLKRRSLARLFAWAWRVRYAWRPAGPRTVVRQSVPAARRPPRMARRELGSGRDGQ